MVVKKQSAEVWRRLHADMCPARRPAGVRLTRSEGREKEKKKKRRNIHTCCTAPVHVPVHSVHRQCSSRGVAGTCSNFSKKKKKNTQKKQKLKLKAGASTGDT